MVSINADIVLLATVNKHEQTQLTTVIEHHLGHRLALIQGNSNEVYLDAGNINNQRIIVANSLIGSTSSGASFDTVNNILEDLTPKLIIAVGIAWGAKNASGQQIGDILLSTRLRDAQHHKAASGNIIPRGTIEAANGTMLKAFLKAADLTHKRAHEGLLISIETLFDDEEHRDKFIAADQNQAIGGEMEGTGLLMAIRRVSDLKVDWLIVKAICDWGFKKSENPLKKEQDQQTAARNASELCIATISNFRLVRPPVPSCSANPTHNITSQSIQTKNMEPFIHHDEEDGEAAQCPYRGLHYFREEDARFYFGRERFSHRLLDTIKRKRLVAVLGASGCGKSSLVRAGFLPQLLAQADGLPWLVVTMHPGKTPFRTLVETLIKFAPNQVFFSPHTNEEMSAHDATERLVSSQLYLLDIITSLVMQLKQKSRFLLFIDQWEEIYTTSTDNSEEVMAFQREILSITEAQVDHRVILAMRNDFYPQLMETVGLRECIQDARVDIPSMSLDELKDAIVRPAALVGINFEAGLVERILRDAASQPGILPLVEFCLLELWQSRQSSFLTHAGYQRAGGVLGALTRRADEIFDAMTQQEKSATRELFLELVFLDPDNVNCVSRRGVPLSDIPKHVQKVANQLADERSRLIVLESSEVNDQPVVQLAHEALIHHWQRLRIWLAEMGDHIRMIVRLRAATNDWVNSGERDDFRWSDERAIEVQRSIDQMPNQGRLRKVDRKFLGPTSIQDIHERLSNDQVSLVERAALGDRLSILGDDRLGVGLTVNGIPKIEWCRVEAGTISLPKIDTKHQKPRRWGSGTVSLEMSHNLNLGSFWIAKYPITVLQFKSFLKSSDGYFNPKWWSFWQQNSTPTKFKLSSLNRPVVNVTWFEATAFCRWLSAKTNQNIALPSEWQWQLAATRGDMNNVYPWGKVWRDDAANCYESGINRLIAVGVTHLEYFGESVCASDMVGNVWEWCLNQFEAPFVEDKNVSKDYTIRGGGWNTSLEFATTTARYRSMPTYRHMNVGFRPILLPD